MTEVGVAASGWQHDSKHEMKMMTIGFNGDDDMIER